jgi:N-acetyl-anhydromuramyl-L-alanine amidase AmpD
MQRKIDLIVIHCSATPNGHTLFTGKLGDKNFTTPVQEIDNWHRARGFKRRAEWRKSQNPKLTSVGYHFVIYTNGAVSTGRHLAEVGAHALGHNASSIGICLLGTDHFSTAQWLSLSELVAGLKKVNPTARVVGHRDLSPDKNHDGKIDRTEWTKTCPGFNVAAWLEAGMKPIVGQTYLDPAEGAIA